MPSGRKPRTTYSQEFKQQIVSLYESGKPRAEILREYELTASAFDRWVRQNKATGSFKEADNKSAEQLELEKLQKEVKQLRMENDIPKASRADYGTKIDIIRNNTHKYSVSAMCGVLNIARSTYYAELQKQTKEQETDEVEVLVKQLFNQSRGIYGTRKIKQELSKLGYCVSRRRIGKIMQANKLLSVYTVAQYKVHKAKCNEDKVENRLARQFEQERPLAVVVSDLTYVRVNNSWNYICLLVDLYNREIIGRSVGKNKDATLVKKAFSNFKGSLKSFGLFHTDRGLEFKNALIEELLTTFDIQRSLSYKGCPYDNAVAESLYKTLKVEFIRKRNFDTLEQLQMELDDYINWYNRHRIHGTLGYLTPIEYRKQNFNNFV
ncbi:MAG: IS3 family transposase [Culicoidibacterales bacterium]